MDCNQCHRACATSAMMVRKKKTGLTRNLVRPVPPEYFHLDGESTPYHVFWWRRGRVALPVQKLPCSDMLQACSALCSRRYGLSPTGSRISQPMKSMAPNIGVLGVAFRNDCTSTSQLPDLLVADVAATRRLERIHVRQLFVRHCFYEGSSSLGLQSVRKRPCRTYASPSD